MPIPTAPRAGDLSCLKASLYIAELVDGSLGERQAVLEDHVEGCVACRRMLLIAVSQQHAEQLASGSIPFDGDARLPAYLAPAEAAADPETPFDVPVAGTLRNLPRVSRPPTHD